MTGIAVNETHSLPHDEGSRRKLRAHKLSAVRLPPRSVADRFPNSFTNCRSLSPYFYEITREYTERRISEIPKIIKRSV